MQPNVLLVVLDSVRAKNLSLYGWVNDTTPFLEAFADEATVYTNARAPSIGSRPSHASLFTGYHAVETGISGQRKLARGTTIWEALRDEGYETAVFSDNPFLRSNRYGFIHGFETVKTRPEDYVDVPFLGGVDPRGDEAATDAVSGLRRALRSDAPTRSLLNGVSVYLSRQSPLLARQLRLDHDTSAWTYVEAFETWLEGCDGPWAACLNLMDAHYPYEPAPEFDHWGSPVLREVQDEWAASKYNPDEFRDGERPWWQIVAFEALYDGSIRELDAAVERLVTLLAEAGHLDETLIVVASDHGEGFGERGYFDPEHRLVAHNATGGIHDEQVHVPLLVQYPQQSKGTRIDTPASLTEFPNVVRSVRDGAADRERDLFVPDGPVIVSLDAGFDQSSLAVYESDSAGVSMQACLGDDGATVRIRDPQIKYVAGDRAAAAREWLDSFSTADITVPQDATDIDRATQKHLDALGYV